MSPINHSNFTTRLLNSPKTPVKASVVLLTAFILASCSSGGGGDTVTSKPTPVIPGGNGGSNDGGTDNDSTDTEALKEAIKAAEARAKAAEAKLKEAETKAKAAEAKAQEAETKIAKAAKELESAKLEAQNKIAAIEKASKSEVAAAKAAAKAATDALKAAEANLNSELAATKAAKEKAVAAAQEEASAAKQAAEAAKAEAEAKIAAAQKASSEQIAAAKKSAQEAIERAKKAESDAKSAELRAKEAEAKAEKEAKDAKVAIEAKLAAEAAAEAANKLAAEQKAKAEAAQKKASDAEAELAQAKADLAAAEKALADALAGGGNTEALQAEVERRQAALEAANAKAAQAEQSAAAAQAAADAQVAAAQKAAKDAQDALAAAQIKNTPEATKSGVQSINVGTTAAGLPSDFVVTTRDFEIGKDNVIARADLASNDLLPKVDVNISGANDKQLANGFKSHDDSTSIPTTLGDLPLTYTSTYKDFGDDMRIGHIDGTASLSGTDIPVNGVAVLGNATKAENMPTEGKVGYTGDATHRKLGIGNAIEFGSSVFTADFVAKNLAGKLSFKEAGDINLKADINGNKFSGSADANAGYATEGGFFGGDAQYLGGVYEGNGAQGTYGAKSDKQTAAEKAAADAQAAADAAQKAIAEEQAKAAAAKAAAEKAQADVVKAQEALEKAQEALENAGEGGDGGLAAALERAAAAEKAQAAAEEVAAAAKKAAETAQAAEKAAKEALVAAQAAADKAVGEAQAEAQKKVAAAKAAEATAKQQAANAQAAAEKAQAEAKKAKADAAIAVKDANDRAAKAEAEAASAKAAAEAANKLAAEQKAKAEAAQKKASDAEAELAQAKADLAAAEKALADALAGGGNTEALQAEVERRQAALEAANAKAAQAEQSAAAAQAAADAQVAAAQKAAKDAQDALAAAQIKNTPEATKSGVQSINVGTTAAGLPSDFVVTTRDFEIGKDNVIARADLASNDLLPKVDVNISGANDKQLANGFKSHDDSTSIPTTLGDLPLTYTSTYKDFGDDMRIGHIDGTASLSGTDIPVNGVAVLGNATKAENMPTEGKVGYTGDATHRKLGIGNAIEFGSSVFTADFVAKNLAGKLSFKEAGDINLKADINGNKFSGSADANAGYATEGGFFGGDAQYLGGVYEGNGAQGTYGAKSDKQTAAEKAAADAQAAADAAQKAIAEEQAKAAAAKAAAEKAQADVVKAQEALEKAQEALENAGEGGDGGLAAALERAAAAEKAQAAAEEVAAAAKKAAETAQAAEKAAKDAQKAAEDALEAEKIAAAKAIGEAKAEAQAKVKVAEAERDEAKANAEAAEAAKKAAENEAEEKITQANQARDEAILAKQDAEAKAKAAEERAKKAEKELEDAKKLPPVPTNPDASASTTISGFQTSTTGKNSTAISSNDTNSYDKLKIVTEDIGTREFQLTADTDSDFGSEFKKSAAYKIGGAFEDKLNYTSVYRNFDGDMQIGHVYGELKAPGNLTRKSTLSTVYVQGKSTDLEDMTYRKQVAQYSIDNKINDGKVEYKGVATYLGNSTNEITGTDPLIGTSEFKVDFVDQQVDGKLSFDNVDDKKIKAEITGNTFKGNWNGVDTQGGFYGEDAQLLGGVYQDAGGKGTYGASKITADPVNPEPADPVDPEEPVGPKNPDVKPDTQMTGFQSTALSSKEKTLPFGLGKLDNAIGYVAIRDDKSDWKELQSNGADQVPVDNRQGDNFKSFDTGLIRGDMVKPDAVLKPIEVSLKQAGSIKVDAGKGGSNPTLKYNSVYQNFNQQMQIGHVYGNFDSLAGEVSRAAHVYVQGYATNQADIDYLKQVNEGKVQYTGSATYIENIHLADNANTAPVNGTSNFNVDFVNNSVKGELAFEGNFKYMPEGNKIGIEATISGNTFAGNVNGIDTAGGFYGVDAKFLGGIYQDASVEGGKGTVAGTGTKFQGTFGAEKQ